MSSAGGVSPGVCKILLENGECRQWGCPFEHDLSSVVCRFWLQGRCSRGAECPFRHQRDAASVASSPLCRFWAAGHCARGDDCRFRHELLTTASVVSQPLPVAGLLPHAAEPVATLDQQSTYAYAWSSLESSSLNSSGYAPSLASIVAQGSGARRVAASSALSSTQAAGSSWASLAASANGRSTGAWSSAVSSSSSDSSSFAAPMKVGEYFAPDLQHPSVTFQACQEAGSSVELLLGALQFGRTMNGVPYVSFRGCPQWAVEAVFEAALRKVLSQSVDGRVVLIAGVGGTDVRTGSHKHKSHTKGGTADSLVAERLKATQQVRSSQVTPLYTAVEGARKYGSYLIRTSR